MNKVYSNIERAITILRLNDRTRIFDKISHALYWVIQDGLVNEQRTMGSLKDIYLGTLQVDHFYETIH